MMKESNAPRRIYTRNDVVHVCFAGQYFGPGAETKIDIDGEVRCELLDEEGTKIKVTQRKPKRKGVTETWHAVRVPRKVRKAA